MKDIVEQNIGRLLGTAYKPETINPEFAQALSDHLCAVAAELAGQRPAVADEVRFRTLRRRLGWGMAVAACVTIWALALYAQQRSPVTLPVAETPAEKTDSEIPKRPLDVGGLLPRRLDASAAPKRLASGEKLTTGANERRRVALADGSILFLNQNTTLTQVTPRELSLAGGEIYLEVAPRKDHPFVVTTPGRRVTALGTHFAVQAQPAGTGVVVTQGKVRLSGIDATVATGERVEPGKKQVVPAPRASHVLDWTRDLMTAAAGPLVPASKHAGGALVAKDPNGQEVNLDLRKFHVDVHIEDGFARTTIDQTYFNTSWARLEGTFYFPLPADASLSRLAMYVEEGGMGRLMEGGMAEREHARNVFETIRYTQRDPALLEWVDGTTFKMRVFPLEGRKEKRIILSYTQRLPGLYGSTRYRFPGGHNMDAVRDWSFRAFLRHGSALNIAADPPMKITRTGTDAVLSVEAKNIKPDRDISLELQEKRTQLFSGAARPGASPSGTRFSTFVHEGSKYLMLRHRPELQVRKEPKKRNWVFLFESSANRDPLLARAQIEIIRYLLLNAEHDDRFAIVTAGTRSRVFDAKFRSATADNIADAVKFLESVHLIGALDLEKALAASAPFSREPQASADTVLVHVGAGTPALGESRDHVLAERIPNGTQYVGIGVGKRWNRAFMKLAAERTAGYYRQINPDEPITWHAFDLLATLNTPRLLNVRVVDSAEKVNFLAETTMVAHGEEICAIARLDAKQEWPTSVHVAGTLNGKPWVRKIEVQEPAGDAGYLPRAWAKLEIDRLVADGSDNNKKKIIELSKASYVMSPFTSLLVLETDADYARFNVDRGRKDHWAMYSCPDRIPIVYDAVNVTVKLPPEKKDVKRSAEDVLKSILVRVPAPVLQYAGEAGYWPVALTAYQLYLGAYAVIADGGTTLLGGFRVPTDPLVTVDVDPASLIPGPNLLLNVKRWTEMSVPGDVDPNAPVGILAGGTSSPVTMPFNVDWVNYYKNHGYQIGGPQAFQGPGGRIQFAPVFVSPTMQWAPTRVFKDGTSNTIGFMSGMPGGTGMGGMMGMTGGGSMPMGMGMMGGGGMAMGLNMMGGGMGMMGGGMMMGGTGMPGGWSGFGPLGQPFAGQPFGLLAAPGQNFGYLAKVADSRKKEFRTLLGTRTLEQLIRNEGFTASGINSRGFAIGINGELAETVWDRAFRAQTDLFTWPSGDLAVNGALPPLFVDPLNWFALPEKEFLYRRPALNGNRELFVDLTRYAPGLQTCASDILAALDAGRAAGDLGHIDPAARVLIERTRASGWEALRLGQTQLVYDGTGRYACERRLPTGLLERVICDGETLLHLYPEIGLGAKRPTSRFSRVDLARLVPWFVPSAEDLAVGAEVKAIDENTVAIVPRAAKNPAAGSRVFHVHLVFGEGKLRERRLVDIPAGKVVYREVYTADGSVTWFSGATKLGESKRQVRPGREPALKVDTSKLLLVPLPLRTVDALLAEATNHDVAKMDAESAIALMAAQCYQKNPTGALEILSKRLSLGDRRLGWYTLLAAAEMATPQNPTWTGPRITIAAEHASTPLGRYLAQHSQLVDGRKGAKASSFSDHPFLRRLALAQELAQLTPAQLKERRADLVAFAKDGAFPEVSWALLAKAEEAAPKNAALQRVLGDAFGRLSKSPGLAYLCRYEQARCLLQAGDRGAARDAFTKLYTDSCRDGVSGLIDADFRKAFVNQPKAYAQFMRKTCADLLKRKQYGPGFALARQNGELNEKGLALELLDRVLEATSGNAKQVLTLVSIPFLRSLKETARAETLLDGLLEDDKLAERPELWRLGAELARERERTRRAALCLETALDLEFKHLPESVNLEMVRADYGRLLEDFQSLAQAMTALDNEVPASFLKRVVRAADRWRSLDPHNTQPCHLAAKIFTTLRAHDLAWEYWTTPLALRPNEAAAWLEMARAAQATDTGLADRAFAAAFEAEPTNAQILWDRAQLLEQTGQHARALDLYRQLADGNWQPRFQNLRDQARVKANQTR